jgi:tRNA (guanine37-N1)-methyltransferase
MIDESYSIQESMSSLEYPQYTRPQDVEWFVVPEVLISWHHAQIEQWKKANKIRIS